MKTRWIMVVNVVVAGAAASASAQVQHEPAGEEHVEAGVKTGGLVQGVVRAADSGEPVPGATVILEGADNGAISESDGRYVLRGVPAGRHVMRVYAAGHATTTVEVDVPEGGAAVLDVTMGSAETTGEVIVVTGSRAPEKLLDSPATVEVVSEQDIETAGGVSYLSALSRVKGIDFADAGINSQQVSMRGFATQFNSRLLSMIDGRVAQLPGSGLPQANLLPAAPIDIKAVEVVVGPASALYGPNAHTGVINVRTKTPWDESGATVAVRGGTQALFDGTARVAGTIANDVGYKINGRYLRADDFAPDRDSATHYYGTSVFEGDLIDDYDVENAVVDGSLYYRFADDWLATATTGWSQSDGFSLTNAGRNHLRNWIVQHQTLQLAGPYLYAQVTRTATDAGGTYQLDRLAAAAEAMGGAPEDPSELDALRDQIKFVDQSQLVDAEVQGRHELFGVKGTVGLQTRFYLPDSGGTYLADSEENIDTREVGGYLQLDAALWDERLRLVGAARVDHHSNYGTQVSPKASAVIRVAPLHNIRVGYNRAYKSPTVLEQFLLINDILVGNRTGFEIRDADGNTVAEVGALDPESVHSIELGYKGVFANRLFVDLVGYDSWYDNFISPLTQLANPAADDPTIAFYPDGEMVAAGTPAAGTLFTYQNFGSAQVRGVDLGLTWLVIHGLELATSVSWIDLVDFTKDEDDPFDDLLLNAPELKLKGSVTVGGLGFPDWFVRVSGRFQSAYRFSSGYWRSASFYDDGKIPARFVADLCAGYELPRQGIAITGTISNLLGDDSVDVIGAPPGHRLAFLQVTYRYAGLRY